VTPPAEASELGEVEESIELEAVAPEYSKEPPHVEVKFPLAGKRIASEKAHDYAIRLKTSHVSDELELAYMLDDFTPLVLDSPDEPVTLGRLVPEDRELGAGTHRLFVAAVDPKRGSVRFEKPRSRAAFSSVEFWVGEAKDSPPPSPSGPELVLLAPSGTYNGSRGQGVLVDFRVLGLGGAERQVEVFVVRTSPGKKASGRLQVPHDALVNIRSLSSGDYQVEVRLLDSEGHAVSSLAGVKSRTITVNRDAPEPR
jgi:hypothetical protein